MFLLSLFFRIPSTILPLFQLFLCTTLFSECLFLKTTQSVFPLRASRIHLFQRLAPHTQAAKCPNSAKSEEQAK